MRPGKIIQVISWKKDSRISKTDADVFETLPIFEILALDDNGLIWHGEKEGNKDWVWERKF